MVEPTMVSQRYADNQLKEYQTILISELAGHSLKEFMSLNFWKGGVCVCVQAGDGITKSNDAKISNLQKGY